MSENSPPEKAVSSLPFQLGAITLTRTLIYTGHRMVYPFLPVLARGMGVTLEMAALAVTIRSALGMLGPLLGSLGDIRGRKWALRLGLGLIAGGTVLVGLLPSYAAFLVGSMFFGLGIVIFDPTVQAYVGDQVPYRRRATAMAVIEIGWSAAFLVGIPLVGRVLSGSGWSVPFLWLGGILFLALFLIQAVLPPSPAAAGPRPRLREGLLQVLRHRSSLASVGVSFLMITGSRSIMIVYGAWFENAFGMSARVLGDVSSVIGVAGVVGLVVVGLVSDRLGKKRSLALGLGLNLAAALLLPWLAGSAAATVSDLFLYYLAFEFTLVTALSLVSELQPEVRATLMAFHAAAISAGDALGSFLGPLIFRGSIAPNSALAVGLNALALVLLLAWVRVED